MFYRILLTIYLTAFFCLIFMGKGSDTVSVWLKIGVFGVLAGVAFLGWAAAEEHAITKRRTP